MAGDKEKDAPVKAVDLMGSMGALLRNATPGYDRNAATKPDTLKKDAVKQDRATTVAAGTSSPPTAQADAPPRPATAQPAQPATPPVAAPLSMTQTATPAAPAQNAGRTVSPQAPRTTAPAHAKNPDAPARTAIDAAANGTSPRDPTPAELEVERQKALGRDSGMIVNSYTAQVAASLHAGSGDKLNGADGREIDPDAERRRKNRDLLDTISVLDAITMAAETVTGLQDTLRAARAERDTLREQHTQVTQEIAAVTAQMDTLTTENNELRRSIGRNRLEEFYLQQDREVLLQAYEAKRAENTARFGTDEHGATLPDPQDEILRQQAWEQNRDAIRADYERRGLGDEFNVLERSRNGEQVDTNALQDAVRNARRRGLSGDLDVDMQRRDPNHAYFQTEDGLRLQIRSNNDYLKNKGDEIDRLENRLNSNIDKLKDLRERHAQLEGDKAKIEQALEKIDAYIEQKEQQLAKAQLLEQKIKDYKDGKISAEDYRQAVSDLQDLRTEIKQSDHAFRTQTGIDLHTGHGGRRGDPAAENNTARANGSRAGTDPAIAARAPAVNDAFQTAASPAPATAPAPAAPDPVVTADNTALQQQQRNAAALTV